MPPKSDVSSLARSWDGYRHFFEQRTKQFFAISVGRGGDRPHTADIFAKPEQLASLWRCNSTRRGGLASCQLGLCGLQFLQSLLPACFQTSCDKSIVRIHGLVAPLGCTRLILSTLHLETPLLECRIAPLLKEGGSSEGSF